MKIKLKCPVRVIVSLIKRAGCAGTILLIASSTLAQNLFVSEGTSIYDITPGGVENAFATGISLPNGMAFDSLGDLFVSDLDGTIDKFTPGGVETTFATGLNFPAGLAFDNAGNLYEADANSHNIYKFTPSGTRSTFATGLIGLDGLAFDTVHNLLFVTSIATGNVGKIFEFTTGGVRSTFASGAIISQMAFDSSGNLFATDQNTGSLYKFTPGGVRSTFATGLNNPVGLAIDSAGNVFEADNSGYNINEFTPDAVESTFNASLPDPVDLAFQPASVPEQPSALGLLVFSTSMLIIRHRKQWCDCNTSRLTPIKPALSTDKKHSGRKRFSFPYNVQPTRPSGLISL
jgi:sugar lactone lactonase YvrE